MPEWISAKERLPVNDADKPWWKRKVYLVYEKSGRMRTAMFSGKENIFITHTGCGIYAHSWMPLPEPPLVCDN